MNKAASTTQVESQYCSWYWPEENTFSRSSLRKYSQRFQRRFGFLRMCSSPSSLSHISFISLFVSPSSVSFLVIASIFLFEISEIYWEFLRESQRFFCKIFCVPESLLSRFCEIKLSCSCKNFNSPEFVDFLFFVRRISTAIKIAQSRIAQRDKRIKNISIVICILYFIKVYKESILIFWISTKFLSHFLIKHEKIKKTSL